MVTDEQASTPEALNPIPFKAETRQLLDIGNFRLALAASHKQTKRETDHKHPNVLPHMSNSPRQRPYVPALGISDFLFPPKPPYPRISLH